MVEDYKDECILLRRLHLLIEAAIQSLNPALLEKYKDIVNKYIYIKKYRDI